MKKQLRRLMGVVLAVLMIASTLPASVFAGETDGKAAGYTGKKVAILGDSISTWIDVSNNTSYNTTIGNNAVYYRPGMYHNMRVEDTWWNQAIDALDMKLLVNNSWSGSCMLRTCAGTPGAYVDRCVQLHDDVTGEEPDVIWIYLGTNDFPNHWGTVDSINPSLVTNNGDGSYHYAEPVSFIEAYAIALHKMHLRYPNAEIYCFGILRRSHISEVLTNCNSETKKLAESMGHTYVDLESCIDNTAEDFRICNGGDELHPAPEGMDRITQKLLSAMLDHDVVDYKISYTLFNATSDNTMSTAWKGCSFSTKLAPNGAYNALNVAVVMDGKNVTAECYRKDGTIFIENVTGNIFITAWGKNAPHTHEYSKVVTAPTSTEKGYTTYTCACGDSYIDDYTNPVGPKPGVRLVGDADGSGEVDYVDAMLALQYHTGVASEDALDLNCCDVDGSGEVDYVDAMLILQYHTGVIGNERWYRVNGTRLSEYTIIYSAADPDYTQRAAIYLQETIAQRTGVLLPVKSDREQVEPLAHEIVIGETIRPISASLAIERGGLQFSLMADQAHIAMEGDYFVIAAAAYYFANTFITEAPTVVAVPKVQDVYEPVVQAAENYIFLIGDGMGVNQTQLFSAYSAESLGAYSDGESAFYGYLFPAVGKARTNSLSGTTDSAAAGTALATGYKTINGYVGKGHDLKDVTSLTEIAAGLGKATAVMSTEVLTGATPAAFSAHANSRNDTDDILVDQKTLSDTRGTLILGNYGAQYDEDTIKNHVECDLQNTLATLSENENGFFLMYEEAYIDKHSHSNERRNTFRAVLRFNQAIGCVMEYAFYHPETFVIITADHETGGLTKAEDGTYYYTTGNHTSADVPVFAYGAGADVFDGVTVENIQIPKTIAKMWGVELVGYDNENYPALALGD